VVRSQDCKAVSVRVMCTVVVTVDVIVCKRSTSTVSHLRH